jgi:REP element-mobilizing transposase RayT
VQVLCGVVSQTPAQVLGEAVAARLATIMHAVFQEHQAEVLRLEIMPDQVHLFVAIERKQKVS